MFRSTNQFDIMKITFYERALKMKEQLFDYDDSDINSVVDYSIKEVPIKLMMIFKIK